MPVIDTFSAHKAVANKSKEERDLHDPEVTTDFANKTFPETLREILSDPTQSSIQWLDHGKSFLIRDRHHFVKHILPKYLGKETKYTSFTRKLSRWKFQRIQCGPEEGAWYNEAFTRDNDYGLKDMRCAKRKHKTGSSGPGFVSASPEKRQATSKSAVKKSKRQQARRKAPSSPRSTTSSPGEGMMMKPSKAPERVRKHKMPLKKRPVDASLFPKLHEADLEERRYQETTENVSSSNKWLSPYDPPTFPPLPMDIASSSAKSIGAFGGHNPFISNNGMHFPPAPSPASLNSFTPFGTDSTTQSIVTAAVQALATASQITSNSAAPAAPTPTMSSSSSNPFQTPAPAPFPSMTGSNASRLDLLRALRRAHGMSPDVGGAMANTSASLMLANAGLLLNNNHNNNNNANTTTRRASDPTQPNADISLQQLLAQANAATR